MLHFGFRMGNKPVYNTYDRKKGIVQRINEESKRAIVSIRTLVTPTETRKTTSDCVADFISG